MRKLFFSLFITYLSSFFVACKDKSNEPSKAYDADSVEQMFVYFTDEEPDNPEAAYISMAADYADWIAYEVFPGSLQHQQWRTIVFLKKTEKFGCIVSGTDKAMYIKPFESLSDLIDDTGLLVKYQEDSYLVAQCKNLYDGNYEITSQITIPKKTTGAQFAKRNNYMEEYELQVYDDMAKFHDTASDQVGYMTDATSVITLVKYKAIDGISKLFSIATWGAKKMMSNGNSIIEKGRHEQIVESDRKVVQAVLFGTTCSNISEWLANKMLNTPFGRELADDDYSGYPPVRFLSQIPAEKVEKTYNSMTEYAKEEGNMILSVSVGQVTENSAKLSGSYSTVTQTQGFISEIGFEYWDMYSLRKHTITVSDIRNGYELTDLWSLTTYGCHTYMISMGRKYYSPQQIFTTKGELTLMPNNVEFSSKGGEELVRISLWTYAYDYFDVSGPSWCGIRKTTSGFFVTVGATEKARKDKITVRVLLKSGETKTVTLPVSQSAPTAVSGDWDGTCWNFNSQNKSMLDFSLCIESTATKSYYLDGFITKSWTELEFSVNNAGKITLWGANSGGSLGRIGSREAEITITRTSATTASALVKYSINEIELFGSGEIHEKGSETLQGYLIEN